MATASEILNDCETLLNDADNDIWTRAELLLWAEDAYRLILSRGQITRALKAMASPPRHSYAISYDWEARFVEGGTYRKFTFPSLSNTMQATHHWELQTLEGQTPTNGNQNVTQLWELAYSIDGGDVEAHYRLYLPRQHSQILGIWFDHEAVNPVSVRELDRLEDDWWTIQGESFVFATGISPERSVDVYEISTTYSQAYEHQDFFAGGTVRGISGDRTYTYSHDTGEQVDAEDAPVGILREISSADRQYFPEEPWQVLGTVRNLESSDGQFLIWHTVVPRRGTMTEGTEIDMIPSRLSKYIKYYVLWKAFARQGEGENEHLANHYEQRFTRVFVTMLRLGSLARRDQNYARLPMSGQKSRIARPRLPSDYPRVRF